MRAADARLEALVNDAAAEGSRREAQLIAAATRRGYCGPLCALTTVSDTASCGVRSIVVKCSVHGPKAVTLQTGRTG